MTRKSIEVFYDGERYDSMTELAQHLGVTRQRVSQAIKQNNKINGKWGSNAISCICILGRGKLTSPNFRKVG